MRERPARLTDARPKGHLGPVATAQVQAPGPQRALIVNGNRDVLEVLEPVLDAGHYDVVFVESSAHAYSQIRRVQPDLVILCLEFDDADSLNVLSMLKLDTSTRDIPVVTYTSAGLLLAEDHDESRDAPLFTESAPPSRMN